MFLMWLGEQMTERGIGNGISLIITAGIAAGLPSGAIQLWTLLDQGSIGAPMAVVILVGALVLIYVVVCFESALRKVPIHYAKRQTGSFFAQNQNTHKL